MITGIETLLPGSRKCSRWCLPCMPGRIGRWFMSTRFGKWLKQIDGPEYIQE